MNYSGYAEYVSVAEKRQRAEKELTRLRDTGQQISPVVIEGTKLAETFWGKAWCRQLDTFADYATRLPRGRNYVRTGAVCHLEVNPGRITALVAGTELYNVSVNVCSLPQQRWNAVKESCTGKIDDLIGLLHGKLTKAVLTRLCDADAGLLPQSSDITFTCSCPDRAAMCKHVAAVLYGVGKRLDTEPELLFTLRQVDAADLLTPEGALSAVLSDTSADSADMLHTSDLDALFGIDLEPAPYEMPELTVLAEPYALSDPVAPSVPDGALSCGPPNGLPQQPLGSDIARLRARTGKSACAFAAELNVSTSTLHRWERSTEPLRLHAASRNALEQMYENLEQTDELHCEALPAIE